MNNRERKTIEAKVRALQFAQSERNITPLSEMKEQVLKACETRLYGKARRRPAEKNNKARLRLILRAALAAACLLMVISVYSLLDPVPISNANSFLRRAQIWIGNVLKVDVAVEPSEKKGVVSGAEPDHSEDISALKDFQEAHGLTVLYPTQLPAGMALGEIKSSGPEDYAAKIAYSYQSQNKALHITIEELPDTGRVSIFAETMEYAVPAGTFYVWEDGTGWHAMAISGSSNIYIGGTMDKDTFFMILDGLRAVH